MIEEERADYEYLGFCTFEAFDGRLDNNGQPAACRREAIARVWWNDYDKAWLACPAHFELVTDIRSDHVAR